MELTPVAMKHEYEIKDGDSGYGYMVYASFDPEFGWSAEVSMRSFGFATEKNAVENLRRAAEHFLSALNK